jgi:hypothetical protein
VKIFTIYRIKPGIFEHINSLVHLIGKVYIDDVPSSALAEIMDDNTGDALAARVADSKTGEFIYSLIPGKKYKISLLADGYAPKIEYVDVPSRAEGVLRIEHRFDFYSLTYLGLHGGTSGLGIQGEMDNNLKLSPMKRVFVM